MADIYMYIEGMRGDVTLFTIPGWSRVMRFSLGQPHTAISHGSGSIEKVGSIIRYSDTLTPRIVETMAAGRQVPLIVLYTATKQEAMTTVIRRCTLTSHSPAGFAIGDNRPMEAVGFDYEQVTPLLGTSTDQIMQIFNGPGRR